MGDTVRFGVSIDEELLANFGDLVNEGNYDNRSEAVRDMIREQLVTQQWEEGEEVKNSGHRPGDIKIQL